MPKPPRIDHLLAGDQAKLTRGSQTLTPSIRFVRPPAGAIHMAPEVFPTGGLVQGRVEGPNAVGNFVPAGLALVAETQVDGQVREDFEIVLDEDLRVHLARAGERCVTGAPA